MSDNDEARVIVEVPAHEPEPERVLLIRRVLIWTVAVAIGALLLSILLSRPDYDSKTVPETLVGEYVCDLPEYSDRYLTLEPSSITFGTGGTSFVTYKILGVEKEQVEGDDNFILHFRDVAGTKFERRVVPDSSGFHFHFASQPEVVWRRFDM